MIYKVKSTLEKYGVSLSGKNVIVALSGGADSMTLMNVLFGLSREIGFTLSAAHVNHGIRGEKADSDERFVVAECEKLGVPLSVHHADVPALAAKKSIGLEECGRRVRYDFFASFGSDCLVATAHTLSDRCETLLLNLTRGASLKGLCSIPPVRGNIIRPLIGCTRDEIEAYCRENEIPFVTDESNFDEDYSRNRIRLNIMPQLKKINPSAEQAFLRLIESAEENEDFFKETAERMLDSMKTDGGYRANDISAEHSAVRGRLIYGLLKREAEIDAEKIHIKMVDDILCGGTAEIIGGTIVKVEDGILSVNPPQEEIAPWKCDFSELCADTPAGKFIGQIINKNELAPTQNVHNKVLDYSCIVGSLELRSRCAGDTFRCAGSDCTKSLKKLFNEKRLKQRSKIPVLADEAGVVWIKDIGCADRCKITEKTQKILVIAEEPEND